MELTSAAIEVTPDAGTPNYPCLMRSRKSGVIVLFTRERVGVVVVPSQRYEVGHACGVWRMATFAPFYGTVSIASKP